MTATAVAVLVFSLYTAYTLLRIQVGGHQQYQDEAARQHYSLRTVESKRGSIYDANGARIASTKTIYRVGITPVDVRSYTRRVTAGEIAAVAGSALGYSEEEMLSFMARTEESYLFLAKDVEEEVVEPLRSWLSEHNVGGFAFDAESERLYSNGDLAGQVIGYTRFDEQILSGALGIELAYDELLSGRPGYSYAKRDNFLSHGVVPYSTPTDLEVQDGADLHLTLQLPIQEILQEELAAAALAAGLSTNVSGMVMDPWTGAILAMGQLPLMTSASPFARPNNVPEVAWESLGTSQIEYLMGEVWRNRNVSDVYEPGSTMKALTTAIGLELGVTNEDELYRDDPIEMRGYTITCAYEPGHGTETLREGFVLSCNPVFVQLGAQIGKERYYDFCHQLGLFDRTGIDLPGEAYAILHENPTDLDFANLTFGESSAVTPLQMLTAYAALANGGYRVTPHLVSEVRRDGAILFEGPDSVQEALFSTQTASRVTALMQEVAATAANRTYGTEGYRIAGKTSTSTDEYSGENTYSYIAFAPADQPRIVALIVLHRPSLDLTSSEAAALPTNRLISRVLEHLGEPRNLTLEDADRLSRIVEVPSLTDFAAAEAASLLSGLGLVADLGDVEMLPDDRVQTQRPAAGTQVSVGSRVRLYREPDVEVEWVAVPDLVGRSFFECQSLAQAVGLNIVAYGQPSGEALAQMPAADGSSTVSSDEDQSGAPGRPDEEEVRLQIGDSITVYFAEAETDPQEPALVNRGE